jgi:hypothetical protein
VSSSCESLALSFVALSSLLVPSHLELTRRKDVGIKIERASTVKIQLKAMNFYVVFHVSSICAKFG